MADIQFVCQRLPKTKDSVEKAKFIDILRRKLNIRSRYLPDHGPSSQIGNRPTALQVPGLEV